MSQEPPTITNDVHKEDHHLHGNRSVTTKKSNVDEFSSITIAAVKANTEAVAAHIVAEQSVRRL